MTTPPLTHAPRRPRAGFGLALGALALSLLPALALAGEGPRMRLERVDVARYPIIKAYLTYAEGDGRIVTGKQREDFKLVFDSNEQGAAADVKLIEQTGEPIYLVVVAQVAGPIDDVFEDVKRGIKGLITAANEMAGSKVAVLAYSQDVKRVVEFTTEAKELEAKLKEGLARDTDATEMHLLDAVRTAIDLLNSKGVPDNARKLIIVFSDGIDASQGEKKAFAELGKRALLAGASSGSPITISTIGYAPFEAAKLRNLNELARQSNGVERVCKTAQDVGAQFGNAADEVKKQYVILFQSVIAGDGREKTIQVLDSTGGKAIYSNNVQKICINTDQAVDEGGPKPFWKKWWFWLFCVALPVILIVFLIIALVARRPKIDGMALEGRPMEGAPMPQVEGANRTMALDVGMLSGKGPTIGWIVGITGTYIDRTFKLKPSRTLIGNAPGCDIVIEDSFMSNQHCEVRYDGSTYSIVDLGSTNGVVLNDKRVQQHDLVDGDTLRLGRTEFRFKSIN